MSEALFYDPAVIKVIRAILVSKGIRADQDLEDAVGEVVLACIEYVRRTGRPPKNVAEAIAIARPFALRYGIGEARKRIRRGKHYVGTTGEADEHAGEGQPLDPAVKEQVFSVIRQVLKDAEIETFADVGAGVRQAELAAENNASAPAMRKRVQKSRERALGALSARGYVVAGGFAALLGGLIALYIGPWRSPERDSSPPIEDVRTLAAEQRRLAAKACREQRWDDCEDALDRAAEFDKRGDSTAEVSALRAAIAAGRRKAGADSGQTP